MEKLNFDIVFFEKIFMNFNNSKFENVIEMKFLICDIEYEFLILFILFKIYYLLWWIVGKVLIFFFVVGKSLLVDCNDFIKFVGDIIF